MICVYIIYELDEIVHSADLLQPVHSKHFRTFKSSCRKTAVIKLKYAMHLKTPKDLLISQIKNILNFVHQLREPMISSQSDSSKIKKIPKMKYFTVKIVMACYYLSNCKVFFR